MKVVKSIAETYSFYFKSNKCSWANFTVNNSTGEFHIQSDNGDWQYRWNLNSLGEKHTAHKKPLISFLADLKTVGYIANKLSYNKHRGEVSAIDENKIKTQIKQLHANLTSPSLDKKEVDLKLDSLDYSSFEGFYTSLEESYNEDFIGLFYSCFEEGLPTEDSYSFSLLKEMHLPAFIQHIQEELKNGN
jgi:hypothetical protein